MAKRRTKSTANIRTLMAKRPTKRTQESHQQVKGGEKEAQKIRKSAREKTKAMGSRINRNLYQEFISISFSCISLSMRSCSFVLMLSASGVSSDSASSSS